VLPIYTSERFIEQEASAQKGFIGWNMDGSVTVAYESGRFFKPWVINFCQVLYYHNPNQDNEGLPWA
jgi:hypothetical protein